MNNTELNEMPMLRSEVLDVKVGDGKKFGDVTDETLSRDFIEWKTLSNGGIAVKLYRKSIGGKPGRNVYGVMPVKRGKKSTNTLVFLLQFYNAPQIEGIERFKKPLQVMLVETSDAMQSFGIASQVYAALCQEGYTVISDNEQYLGGKKLWERIIKDAVANGLKVSVYNEVDQEEEPYDPLRASVYWQEDYDGKDWLLILRKK